VDVNQTTTDTGYTALNAGCIGGHTEVVRMLLRVEGVDVNKATSEGANTHGCTPLFTACADGFTDVVRMLLAYEGIDVNLASIDAGETPLHAACYAGHTDVVRVLLAHGGVDVNQARTDSGSTPFYTACFGGHTELVMMLLVHGGVDVNQARTDDEIDVGYTPLAGSCDQGHIEVVRMLLRTDGINANQASPEGITPLHAAAYTGHLAIAQQLVVFGADMTATDAGDATPLQDATNQEQPALVEWLGAVKRWSPLQVAAGCRLHNAVAFQLKQGRMDPDASLSWPQMQLAREAAAAPPAKLPWGNAPAVCPTTTKLIKAATRGWTPTAHWLHHTNIQTAVHTILLVSERLHMASLVDARAPAAAIAALPILPPEMWVAVLRFLLRRHWAVSPLLQPP
jgi:ankyrin repeat protein